MPVAEADPGPTRRAAGQAEALLSRWGVLTREAVAAEGLAGGALAAWVARGERELLTFAREDAPRSVAEVHRAIAADEAKAAGGGEPEPA